MSDQNIAVPESPFVHLHVHTEFSLLDGLSKIDKVVARAKAQGMSALAITDHGTMHGVVNFYRACKAAEIKPIIGIEAYLAKTTRDKKDPTERQPYHLLLLAKNQTGYLNLLQLASEAQLSGFYGKPRVDKDLLARYSEGVICTSGCLAAEIPRHFAEGREADAFRLIGEYQDIFGKENFFLELQAHDIPELNTLNEWLVRYRGKADVPMLATNDVHYVLQADSEAHDTLLCIQTGRLKADVKRMRMSDPSYYLRSGAEMWDLFGDVAPESLLNTVRVAEMCEVSLDNIGYHLPNFYVPPGYNTATFLHHLAERGSYWRYGDQAESEVIRTRLEYELRVINKMGFDTYFLIVWDLCQFARSRGIWWNVRGSGAGSVVAYCLSITSIDPIENELIFERFLNPGRQTMPDIDMDFPDDQRAEMIEYAVRKYGEQRVAAIITFGTLKARAAIKDVARALDYPLEQANALTQLVPAIPSHPVTLAQCLSDDPEYEVKELKARYNGDAETKNVLDTALSVEGVARSAGTHAAGVIISDQPLVNYLPLHRPTSDNVGGVPIRRVTQFPMEICESIGLLKVDFLGLSTLSVMRRACELIARYHDIRYTLHNIPYRPDPADAAMTRQVEQAFELIGSGEGVGIFQLESQGMRKMLMEMRPTKFEHIVAAISLYRPGPMQFIDTYVRRMHGDEPIEYLHPRLEPILKDTYGITVYQEQIQRIGADLFGYSLGDADLMRRAVSKKKAKDLAKHKEVFMEKGPTYGVSAAIAEKIFDQVEFFAAYGFNKCLVANTEVIDAATGRVVRIGDLASGTAKLTQTLTCDTDHLTLHAGAVEAVHINGVKPVYRLITQLGRQIDATANHPFYTFDGWRNLDQLAIGEQIAVPRRLPIEGHTEWPQAQITALAQQIVADQIDALPVECFELTNAQTRILCDTITDLSNLSERDFCLSSEITARQVQHLYLRLGCLTTVQHLESVLTIDNGSGAIGKRCVLSIITDEPDQPDIYWDRVVSIEYLGGQMTYDLTIPGTHNFIANDILVHNSHAADYAVITCQTAFLKRHYPEEYYTALLSVTRDNIDDVQLFTSDCRRLGISILGPSLNASELDFTIESVELAEEHKRSIRFGLGAIKGVGDKASEAILTERKFGGPFISLSDFARRVNLQIMGGRRPLEALIKVGVFDSFGDRAVMLKVLDTLLTRSKKVRHDLQSGQADLFGEAGGGLQIIEDDAELFRTAGKVEPISEREKLDAEKELIGLYISAHPLDRFLSMADNLPGLVYSTKMKEDEALNGRPCAVIGIVAALRIVNTKKGDTMAIATIEDRLGRLDGVFFPRTWAKCKDEIKQGEAYIFYGKADTTRPEPQIMVDRVTQDVERATDADDDYYSYGGGGYGDGKGDHNGHKPLGNGQSNGSSTGHDHTQPPIAQTAAPSTAAPVAIRELPPDARPNPGIAYRAADPFEEEDEDAEAMPPLHYTLTVTFVLPEGETAPDVWMRRIERMYNHIIQFPGADVLVFRIPDPDTQAIQLFTFQDRIDAALARDYLTDQLHTTERWSLVELLEP